MATLLLLRRHAHRRRALPLAARLASHILRPLAPAVPLAALLAPAQVCAQQPAASAPAPPPTSPATSAAPAAPATSAAPAAPATSAAPAAPAASAVAAPPAVSAAPAAPAASTAPAAPPPSAGATRAEAQPAEEPSTAPAPPGTEKPWENQPPERRYGFTAGIAGGVMLGSSAGYPNDALKIGYERYYTETGVGIGGGGSAWIGAALTDWLVFGLGGALSGMIAGDTRTSTYSFMFHTDVFPVYWLGGVWRDVGVNLDTGFALSTTATAEDEPDLIDGGGSSRIAFGAFYEGVRLWKLSMGPWVYIDYTWSSSVRQPGFYLGWRTALYTKP